MKLKIPILGARWKRSTPHDSGKGGYNAYTVISVTNIKHAHPDHPPQVVYQGDNGNAWSCPLAQWPASLVPELADAPDSYLYVEVEYGES